MTARSVLFYIELILFWLGVNGQFPRACTDRQSLSLRQCCPVGADGSLCGVTSNRGACLALQLPPTYLTYNETRHFLFDERAAWPTAFYDRACICRDNYYGLDCSSCRPGYEGAKCDQKSEIKVRRNIHSLSSSELAEYIDIIDRSKYLISETYVILTNSYDRILKGEEPKFENITVYDMFVWMHYHATRNNFILPDWVMSRWDNSVSFTNAIRLDLLREHLPRLRLEDYNQIEPNVDYAHEGPTFPLWHRYFMLKWETEIATFVAKDPTFTLPYWDWRDQQTCDVCNNAMFGAKNAGDPSRLSEMSRFYRWNTTCLFGDAYIQDGKQCSGAPEGDLLRNFGNFDRARITGLPSSKDVDNIFKLGTEYDGEDFDSCTSESFRNLLEGFVDPETGDNYCGQATRVSYIHNAVHLFMNGTMSEVPYSSNEPIFVVHHVFIDSLFETWLRYLQRMNHQEMYSRARLGHRPQDFMVPFFPLVRNVNGFEGAKELGYTYDYIDQQERELGLDGKLWKSLIGGVSTCRDESRLKSIDENLSLTFNMVAACIALIAFAIIIGVVYIIVNACK